jgi:DNA-binding transcriptional LysR family regulator
VLGTRLQGTLVGVSLAQIEYFVAVAEAGHVGRAAQKLHIAQPAVSRQLRMLEDELRAPLFIRTPRGMRLSEAGAVFLQHARGILGGLEAARAAVHHATTPPYTRSGGPRG